MKPARALVFDRYSRLLASRADVARAVVGGRTVGIGYALARTVACRSLELSGATHDGPLVGAGHRLPTLRNARERVRVVDLVTAGERLDKESVALRVVAGGVGELGGHSFLLLHASHRALQSGAIPLR